MRCHPFERLDTGRYGSNDVRVIQRTNSPHGSLNPSFQKKHLLFPSPFPWSVFSERGNEDKSFLVKGKALRGRRGVVEATGELLLSAANPRRELPLLLSPPLLFTLSPTLCFHSPFFLNGPPPTPYYVDPSDVLYHFTSILRLLPGEEGRETSLFAVHSSIMNVYVFDQILVCSFQYDVKATIPSKSTRVNHDLIFLKFFYDTFTLFSIYFVKIIRITIFWKNEYYLIN